MASVKVAVRVRPFNQREIDLKSSSIIEMENETTVISNPKGDARDRGKDFTFDHSYWSMDSNMLEKYASQKQVFQDLGLDVIKSAYEGYNACIFAYGQTGSGKTYTMMGRPDDCGLIPRICEELFSRMQDETMVYRTEVSYLEIYNEKVRDLVKVSNGKDLHSLRVREHPKEGPYVQNLSKHIVANYDDISQLMEKGNSNRTTASTNMNDTSSRSHAIFTIVFSQAKFSKNSPIETKSKIHLVDLAGSERADATGATGQRLKEGSSINKSLVTLSTVISTLADISEKSNASRRAFIPYRDSTLTWLLKDSLGGNAKTIMIATVSPAGVNYPETLSTLRYANRAKSIVNKPTVNEDPNVKLIRELREEISQLKSMLSENEVTPIVKEKLHESEARVKVLTAEWAGRWGETASILQEKKDLALRKEGRGVVLDSELPHLIGIDDDLFSTGIMLYHLKMGLTRIGTDDAVESQDIVLQGADIMTEHCFIEHEGSVVTLVPLGDALCMVNGHHITDPLRLSQGAVIMLGKTNIFRFNHPTQAARLRKEYAGLPPSSNLNRSRSSILHSSLSMSDLCRSMTDVCQSISTDNLALGSSNWEMDQHHQEQLDQLETKRQEIEGLEEQFQQREAVRLQEQQGVETQLEERKRNLASMLEEAESAKEEAEEAKREAAEETARWKRRSMDVERQLSEWRENQDTSTDMQHEQGSKLPERKAERMSDILEEGLEKLRTSQLADLQRLQRQSKVIEEEVEDKHQLMEKIEEHVLTDGEMLAVQKEKQILEEQAQQLTRMKADVREFFSLKEDHQLDANTLHLLQEESTRVASALELAEQQELSIDAESAQEKQESDSWLKQQNEELRVEWEFIEADHIYLHDLEESIALSNEEVPEDEMAAIKEEKARLEEVHQEIQCREREVEEKMTLKLARIELKHTQRMEGVTKEKTEAQDHWQQLVEGQVTQRQEQIHQMESSQKMAEEATMRLLQLQNDVQVAEKQLYEKHLQLQGLEEKQTSEFQRAKQEVQQLQQQMHTHEMENEVSLIHSQLQSLALLLEADGQNPNWDIFEQCRKFSEAAATYEQQKSVVPSVTQSENSDSEVDDLESQLNRVEHELREQRESYALQRQEELDTIDLERFHLQEMEDRERINALVEQEVKRRLLEERVEREKMRRMEREREKLLREREIWRIRRAHARDLEVLKQKFDQRGEPPSETTLRKANPYASLTNTGGYNPERHLHRMKIARSMSSLNTMNRHENPFRITIPTFAHRGSGLEAHYEFEVKCHVLDETWTVFRRYNRFRELHLDLRQQYPEVSALVFPPKRWFSSYSDKIAEERKQHLEDYVHNLLTVLFHRRNCALHPSQTLIYSKQVLCDLHPFFKKGVFENGKYSTG